MSVKQRLGRVAPRWVVRQYRKMATAVEFFRDYRDYAASTAWERGAGFGDARRDDRESLDSRITIAYHGIEKGTSFPEPRRPFGIARRQELNELLAIATTRSGNGTSPSVLHARTAVAALDAYNSSGEISDEVTPLSNWVSRGYPFDKVAHFVTTRHSVRNFDPMIGIEPSLIEQIVALAGTTPSVCNRRSYVAHYYDDRATIDSLLSLQNGNSGFGHTVPGLFVVTERRSSFVGAGERNQRWVDGGLFAMTLVWVCHALGLGSCFLNWSQGNAHSDKLRAAASIDASEDVVVLIAVGYPAEGHRVARSPRRPLGEVLVHHRTTGVGTQ